MHFFRFRVRSMTDGFNHWVDGDGFPDHIALETLTSREWFAECHRQQGTPLGLTEGPNHPFLLCGVTHSEPIEQDADLRQALSRAVQNDEPVL